jgi:uncharacterized protein YkwD
MFSASVAFAAVAVAAMAMVLSPAPTASAAVGDCNPAADWGTLRNDYANQVLQLVNAHRQGRGLSALKLSPTLTNAADWKSLHMAKYGYMTHNDPAPPVARTTAERLVACGYPAMQSGWGENIAYGYTSPQSVMQAWLNSPGHRDNIERASFRTIGVGAASSASGRLYWTQAFGSFDDSGSGGSPSPTPTQSPAATPTQPPTPTPTQPAGTTITAFPGSVAISEGSPRATQVSRLAANDGSYFQLDSVWGRTSYDARISGVPNSVASMTVTYRGKNSRTCAQTLAVWDATAGSWLQLDTRGVGDSEVEIRVTLAGSLANYVSGLTGNGEVTIRVSCARASGGSFRSMGDLMKIEYR